MDVSHEVRRLAELLQRRIRGAGYSQRAVEEALGWGAGYVSQLLRGNQDLKVKHVLAILGAIGADAEGFFAEFAGLATPPRARRAPTAEELRPLVEEMVETAVQRAVQDALDPGLHAQLRNGTHH